MGNRHTHHHHHHPPGPSLQEQIQAVNSKRQAESDNFNRLKEELRSHENAILERERASQKTCQEQMAHLANLKLMEVKEREEFCNAERKRLDDCAAAHDKKIAQLKEKLLVLQREQASEQAAYNTLSQTCALEKARVEEEQRENTALIEKDIIQLNEHLEGIAKAQADALGFSTVNENARIAMARLQQMIFSLPRHGSTSQQYLKEVVTTLQNMLNFEFKGYLTTLKSINERIGAGGSLFVTMKKKALLAHLRDEDEGLGDNDDYAAFITYCEKNNVSAMQAKQRVENADFPAFASFSADSRSFIVENLFELSINSLSDLDKYLQVVTKYSGSLDVFLMWRSRVREATEVQKAVMMNNQRLAIQ